jgi:hypothetical protein
VKFLLASLLAVSIPTCCPPAAKQKSAEANVLSGAYAKSMDAGKTTPDQDKQHIHSMDNEILQLDAALRGTSNAAATRKLVAP